MIDLAARLGRVRRTPFSVDAPLLICQGRQRRGALILDAVSGLREVSFDPAATLPGADGRNPLFRGLAHDGALTLLMLDLDQVLSLDPAPGRRAVEAFVIAEERHAGHE
ncbi:putative CheW protein [Magnetofaba australis IT-1]|uniref:Putative CheW protein n=1 Tax=Magnetofaba australis IT-1 TaxID=1434232 RepID=A0A1Y2K1Y6_9PROT|nr:putative CheW protein [Magnetofaba australis IT-1]